jgi:kynurenine formamidase
MKISAVGIDTLSIDLLSSASFPAHKTLLAKDIYIIENLCNLDKIPERFKFIGLPLKVKGATASPIRAVGILYRGVHNSFLRFFCFF